MSYIVHRESCHCGQPSLPGKVLLLLIQLVNYIQNPNTSKGTKGIRNYQKICQEMILYHTLPETNSLPPKIGRAPKANDRIPTIHFQV